MYNIVLFVQVGPKELDNKFIFIVFAQFVGSRMSLVPKMSSLKEDNTKLKVRIIIPRILIKSYSPGIKSTKYNGPLAFLWEWN